MKKIFEPVKIGNMELKNRIVRSATMTDKVCFEHNYTPYATQNSVELAKNKVALIISGFISVGKNGSASDFSPRAKDESFKSQFSEICNEVHRNGGKVAAQLAHGGINAMEIDEGEYRMCPSDAVSAFGFEARAMTREEIVEVIEDFGVAAKVCKEAGADAVQIHAAHGYLLSEFLSPYINKREDEYGGSLENRAKIVFDVYKEIRNNVGKDYPILIKINYDDLVDENGLGKGFTGEECIWVCKQLDKLGIDAIEVSSGLSVSRETRPMQKVIEGMSEGHFTQGALKVADEVNCTVISVGGYRTKEQVMNALNAGKIDMISMSRPFRNTSYISDWN